MISFEKPSKKQIIGTIIVTNHLFAPYILYFVPEWVENIMIILLLINTIGMAWVGWNVGTYLLNKLKQRDEDNLT